MTYGEFVRRAVTLLIMIGVSIFVISAIMNLRSILLTVFFCWVLSLGLNSLIIRLQRLGVGRTVATLSTLVGVVLGLVWVLTIVIPPFIAQATNLVESLPGAIEDGIAAYDRFWQDNEQFQEVLPEFNVEDYNSLLETELADIIETEDVAGSLNVNSILASALPILGGIGNVVGSLLANITLIILITGYLLADPLVYYRPIVAMVPIEREKRTIEILNQIRDNVTAWMGALSLSITFTTVTVSLVLGFIFQIPNAFALGVLSGVATIVPNVGYYLGLIPILIFTAADDLAKVIPVAIVYWLLNEFEGKIISPNLMKRQLSLPAGVVLPFQIIAAASLGFYGILLAVPILAILVTIVRELYVFDVLGKSPNRYRMSQDDEGDIHLTSATSEPEPEPVPESAAAT